MKTGMSRSSKARLETCHQDIQRVFNKVAETERIQIIEGRRTKQRQRELVLAGKSKTMDSKHITDEDGLSDAVDAAPINPEGEIDWNNSKAFYAFGERVLAVARSMGITLRFGGDWDMDGDYLDQKFNDLVHFERA